MLISKQWNNKASDIKLVYLYSTSTHTLCGIPFLHGQYWCPCTFSRDSTNAAKARILARHFSKICSSTPVAFTSAIDILSPKVWSSLLLSFRLFSKSPSRFLTCCTAITTRLKQQAVNFDKAKMFRPWKPNHTMNIFTGPGFQCLSVNVHLSHK